MSPRSGKVVVKKILAGSPADKAGLKKGDVIFSVAGNKVSSPGDVVKAYRGKKIGSRLPVRYGRAGSIRATTLMLTKRPGLTKLLRLLLVGEKAPVFRAKTVDGKTVSSATLRGNVVLIEFWATWCKSCVISLKKIAKMYPSLKPKGFRVVALARNKLAEVKPKARKLNLPFVVGADPNARIARKFHFAKVPSLVLIDRKGTIRGIWIGSSYSLTDMKKKVLHWLKKRR
jgi:peroxiredoxin